VVATRSASSDPRGDLWLPPPLREQLARPLGSVLGTEAARTRLRRTGTFATCGDVVTANALAWGLRPFAAVVDGKTLRNEVRGLQPFAELARQRELRVTNAAGWVTRALREAVHALIQGGGGLLVVDGEEDLAALPLLLEMPAGATVIYGQPGAGVCFVTVDAAVQERVRTMLNQMETRSTHGD
jgi:uncharacterized protein (UPF0218 family)